jgi:prepilin-type N-terminal cleavage/methylation domain-containing protein
MMKSLGGYTLMEMAIVVAVIGIMTSMISPMFGAFMSFRKQTYNDRQSLVNQAIGRAFLEYAAQTSGRLPSPYNNPTQGLYYSPLDVTATDILTTSVIAQVAKLGVSQDEIQHDGSGGQKLRVFQVVDDLSMTLPAYFQSGPQVVLNYQFGVVYSTGCRKLDTGCNTGVSENPPGDSSQLSSTNYTSWTLSGTDLSVYPISTLSLQKSMLETTVKRLDKLRSVFADYTIARINAADPSDTTNMSPAGSASDGTNNQGCVEGWFDLSAGSSSTLKTVGLQPEEFGKTVWGAPIHFCREYRPAGGNSPPYYQAFRINKNVSSQTVPDAINEANNVFFSF